MADTRPVDAARTDDANEEIATGITTVDAVADTPEGSSAPEGSGSPSTDAAREFRTRMRGYDRDAVDLAIAQLEAEVDKLTGRVAAQERLIGTLQEKVRGARMELRFWNDRESFIEAELERARAKAADIEAAARDRAAQAEKEAQQRAIKMIDRVCTEANGILTHAREEAHALVARYDDDLDLSERRIQQLTSIQSDIVTAMRGAMQRFEDGITELSTASPSAMSMRNPTPVRARRPRARRTAAAIAALDAGIVDTRSQVRLGSGASSNTASTADGTIAPAGTGLDPVVLQGPR